MYPLQLWLLKRYCRKYGLDYQEIDYTLDYWENKAHLQELFLRTEVPGIDRMYGALVTDRGGISDWRNKEREWESQMEWYFEQHFLEQYIAYIEAGWTKREEVGEPYYVGLFSLERWIQSR